MHRRTVERAVDEFAGRVAERIPDRLLEIVLYGSWARGTARPDSDVDLLVVVESRDTQITDLIQGVALDVDLEHMTLLSVKVCPVSKMDEMRRIGDPFLAAVETEGRTVWTRTSRAASGTA